MPTRDLKFRYLGDTKSLSKASGKAERALGGVDKKARGAGRGMGILRGGAAKLGLVLGGAVLIGGAAKAISRAEDLNSAYAATEQIILKTGKAAGLTGKDIKDLAAESSILTGIDKELILQGDNLLLTFKNIKNEGAEPAREIFQRTHDIMLDLSTVMGTDAKSSALQLGKALQDPIKGLSSLQRIGVTFTDVQREQIRNFVEGGDRAAAQGIILDELESQVGGVAVATADSTEKISNAWKEVQEQIGNILLPTVDSLVPAFQGAAEKAAAIPSGVRNIGIAVETARRGFSKFVDVVDFAAGPVVNLTDAWTDQQEMVFQVTRKIGDYEASIRNGITESQAFQGTLLSMAEAGDIQIGTLKELITQTGISNEGLRDAILVLLRNQEEYGLTADMADLLKRELNKLDTAAGDTKGALGDMEGGLDDATGAADDTATAIGGVQKAMKELLDPVFKAEQATDRFNETLARVQEDSILTQDELEELTGDLADMKAANEAVTPDSLVAYGEASREALGLLDDSTDVSRGKLDLLAQAGTADMQTIVREAGKFFETPLRVEIRASAPSRATMDRLVREALVRQFRRQTGNFG